jgi:glycosyltransferase involved in cell wall biosynthesis
VPEVIVDGVTGLLTQPNSTDIAVAVDRLLADPTLRAAMGAAAARRAGERFSRGRLVGDTERLYLDLAERLRFP